MTNDAMLLFFSPMNRKFVLIDIDFEEEEKNSNVISNYCVNIAEIESTQS